MSAQHTLHVRDLHAAFPARTVLDSVDFTVSPGQLLGLIGENGSGKSTLCRVLAGADLPRGLAVSGAVERPAGVGYLAQDSGLNLQHTVSEAMAVALAPLHDAVAQVECLGAELDGPLADPTRYAAALDWAVAHDAWDADRRAEVAAHHLGLETVPRDRVVGSLSGGQRARLALAALLVARPDFLVLDEPTNHLDDRALTFLQDELRALRSTSSVVVIASHDRTLLDAVCTHLYDLDPSHFGTDGRGGKLFGGSFSDYLSHRDAALQRWHDSWLAQREEIKRWEQAGTVRAEDVAHNRGPRDSDGFIYAFKGSRTQNAAARRGRDAQRRVEVLRENEIRKPPKPLRFSGLPASSAASISASGVRVSGRLRCDELSVGAGEHLLVVGGNGTGKSTLLACLAGALTPDSGTVLSDAQRLGYLPQESRWARPDRSAAETYELTGATLPLRDLGLVHSRDLHRPVAELSLGQQRRLALAIVLARGCDLLLLDEPTNHLSLALVEEIEAAVATTPVTVVLASHDRWLRSRWSAPVLALQAP